MRPIRTAEELYDFIALVVVCAPDRFFEEAYLAPNEQMNLARAFERLGTGITALYPDDHWAAKRQELSNVLSLALRAYESGNHIEGARLVHVFEDGIFRKA